MAQEIWFQRSDGVKMACIEGTQAFEQMTRDGSFRRVGDEGGQTVAVNTTPDATWSKKDLLAYAADKGIEVNPKVKAAEILAVINEAEKAAAE